MHTQARPFRCLKRTRERTAQSARHALRASLGIADEVCADGRGRVALDVLKERYPDTCRESSWHAAYASAKLLLLTHGGPEPEIGHRWRMGIIQSFRPVERWAAHMAQAVPALIKVTTIPKYLESIPNVGIPDKVDGNYLKGLGFKDTNDRAVIPLFKSLGFLDSAGKPTELYRSYRGASANEAKKVLGGAVKKTYAGLFRTYQDAYRKDDEALANWIRANTEGGADTQRRALNTFKKLRDAATFDDAPAPAVDVTPVNPADNGSASQGDNGSGQVQNLRTKTTPGVTINVTLQIAATNDAKIYDQFFASMKKHLFPDGS